LHIVADAQKSRESLVLPALIGATEMHLDPQQISLYPQGHSYHWWPRRG